MEAGKIPFWWAVPIGLMYPVIQVLIFIVRFGGFNTDVAPLDYVLFFAAGLIGALLLILFLRRSKSKAGRWIILTAYILAAPLAVAGMVVGGLLGPVGVVLFSLMPWLLFMWLGYLAGAFLPK